jgi:hypothetical protein
MKAKLGVISQRRWYPPTLRVKKAMDEGKIQIHGKNGEEARKTMELFTDI